MGTPLDTIGNKEVREVLKTPEVRNAAQTRRGATQLDMWTGSGQETHLRQAERNLSEVFERANETPSLESLLERKNAILTPERIQALPKLDGKLDIRKGAPMKPDEQIMLRDIRKKLQATASLTASSAKKKRHAGQALPYFPAVDEKGEVHNMLQWRRRLQDDLEDVNDPTRIGTGVPEERQKVFKAYSDLLAELIALNTPEKERKFVGKNGSALGPQKFLERLCRDPDAIKNGSRFALLIAAGALLALWAVIDFRNKKISFTTLGLLGGVVLLMQNGSKFGFLGSKEFSKAAREGFDGATVKKLQGLAVNKPAAFNNMVKTMDSLAHHGKPITQDIVDGLIKPTKKSGGKERADNTRAVAEEIANKLLGKNPGSMAFTLKGIRGTARSSDRDIVSQFADANNKQGDLRQDLQTIASSSAP